MTRLLLCTATILALTASAHAQSGGPAMGGGFAVCVLGTPNCFRRDAPACAKEPSWSASAKCPSQPPRIKQPRR
jgi:hypothetical protein